MIVDRVRPGDNKTLLVVRRATKKPAEETMAEVTVAYDGGAIQVTVSRWEGVSLPVKFTVAD
jgi:hypothetical protein